MKKSEICLWTVRIVACLQLVLSVSACSLPDDQKVEFGYLRISFDSGGSLPTRAGETVPDTSDFLLTIHSTSGKIIYEGKFGDCPESLEVPSGSYTVKATSSEFTKPAFSSPQYGDEQCIIVPSRAVAYVKLLCHQVNAGVRLNIDRSFLTGCPGGSLFLKSSQGKLMYSYSEKRIAYFSPGQVSLILSEEGVDKTLLSRNLQPQQVLVLGISAAQGNGSSQSEGFGGLSVSVDTTRVWTEDEYVIGGSSNQGSTFENALNVAQAISSAPMEDVWVSGYIVGGDLTSTSCSFEEPFKSASHLLLGPRSSTTDRSACISVQLPSGSVREDLNLVSNPEKLGTKVWLKGDLVESYFNMPGLKNVEEYR